MRRVFALTIAAAALRADTLTLSDGSLFNARTSVDETKTRFLISYRVKGGPPQTQFLLRESVLNIRFNSLDNNAEAPPASAQPRGGPSGELSCSVTLGKGRSEKGALKDIQEDRIILDDKVYLKEDISVLRIKH